jgi:hypothetical protein
MKHPTKILFTAVMIVVAPLVWAAEEVQWVRVTVLLEPGPDATVRVGQTLVPGGIYSLAEVEGRGLDAIDREISDRIRFLGEQMRDVEASMRLATLLARQYYLALEIGKASTLPVIDLNPRLGIVISPQRFSESRAVCKVQFLEPEGPNAKPDFVGDPITLKLKDADLQDVLRTFSKITPFSVEIDPSIDRVVTVDLHDVPWDQALDLILRVNGLAWTREGDTLKVEPLNEMSRRKRVRTDATVNLPRDEWGSATIASRGDAENPTVVLVVESVDGPPGLAAERDGLVTPTKVVLVSTPDERPDDLGGELAVIRARATTTGELEDVEILASPSAGYSRMLRTAIESWVLRTVLDEAGRKQEAIVGYGLRLRPQRVLASIGAVEHITFEVSCRPVPDKPGMYVIRAKVLDLDTGRVISNPQVFTMAGSEAKVRTGMRMPSGELTELHMSFLVSEDGMKIRYSWQLTSKDKVLSSHTADFEL